MLPGFVFCLVAWLSLTAAVQAQPTLQEGGLLFQSLCVQCHGTQAGGHEQLKVPAIAGLPDWYVMGQFQHFDQGRRGSVADGPQAMVMAATLKAIPEAQRRSIAAYVECAATPGARACPSPRLASGHKRGPPAFSGALHGMPPLQRDRRAGVWQPAAAGFPGLVSALATAEIPDRRARGLLAEGCQRSQDGARLPLR